jgi:hypothetical protein
MTLKRSLETKNESNIRRKIEADKIDIRRNLET